MQLIKIVEEKRHESEQEAIDYIAAQREEAKTADYSITKAAYTYKCKKAKGIVILECWVSSITKDYGPLWSEEEIIIAKGGE